MHLIRFTGEWVVYYTLLALGGAALVAFAARPDLVAADRDLLILMAAILVLVLGLVLPPVFAFA